MQAHQGAQRPLIKSKHLAACALNFHSILQKSYGSSGIMAHPSRESKERKESSFRYLVGGNKRAREVDPTNPLTPARPNFAKGANARRRADPAVTLTPSPLQ